jgi:hypothetical protein
MQTGNGGALYLALLARLVVVGRHLRVLLLVLDVAELGREVLRVRRVVLIGLNTTSAVSRKLRETALAFFFVARFFAGALAAGAFFAGAFFFGFSSSSPSSSSSSFCARNCERPDGTT